MQFVFYITYIRIFLWYITLRSVSEWSKRLKEEKFYLQKRSKEVIKLSLSAPIQSHRLPASLDTDWRGAQWVTLLIRSDSFLLIQLDCTFSGPVNNYCTHTHNIRHTDTTYHICMQQGENAEWCIIQFPGLHWPSGSTHVKRVTHSLNSIQCLARFHCIIN